MNSKDHRITPPSPIPFVGCNFTFKVATTWATEFKHFIMLKTLLLKSTVSLAEWMAPKKSKLYIYHQNGPNPKSLKFMNSGSENLMLKSTSCLVPRKGGDQDLISKPKFCPSPLRMRCARPRRCRAHPRASYLNLLLSLVMAGARSFFRAGVPSYTCLPFV